MIWLQWGGTFVVTCGMPRVARITLIVLAAGLVPEHVRIRGVVTAVAAVAVAAGLAAGGSARHRGERRDTNGDNECFGCISRGRAQGNRRQRAGYSEMRGGRR